MSREDLFDRYLTDLLTPDDVEELKSLLRDDRAASEFVEYVEETALLIRIGTQLQATPETIEVEDVVPVSTSARWARSRKAASLSKRILAIAVSLVVVLVTGVILYRSYTKSPLVAVLQEVDGDVEIISDGNATAAEPGMQIRCGMGIQSRGAASSATVEYPDKSFVKIFGDSRIDLDKTAAGQSICLRDGSMTGEFAKQQSDQPFVVATPHAVATILGTKIKMVVDKETMILGVAKGLVRLERKSDGEEVHVEAGMFAVVTPRAELVAIQWVPPERVADVAAQTAFLRRLPTEAGTLTFQQGTGGYAGAVDTKLEQQHPQADNSRLDLLSVDMSVAESGMATQTLLRFEGLFGPGEGQIPRGSYIVSAYLEIPVTDEGEPIRAHRMLRAWSDRDGWDTFGGDGVQPGGEAAATPDVTTGPLGVGTARIDVTPSLRVWAKRPAANFGWALLPTQGNAVKFPSSETATPPRLVMEIRMVPRGQDPP